MRPTRSASPAVGRPHHAARSPWVERAGRAGMTCKALLYLLVGLLALRVAGGDFGEEPDSRGALRAIGRQPLGRGLLVALAVGLVGYARRPRRPPARAAG